MLNTHALYDSLALCSEYVIVNFSWFIFRFSTVFVKFHWFRAADSSKRCVLCGAPLSWGGEYCTCLMGVKLTINRSLHRYELRVHCCGSLVEPVG